MEQPHRAVQPSDVSSVISGSLGARILVIGDVMLDEYVEGRVERISPEAPVPVVTVDGEQWAPGGAAHVAHVITAMGSSVDLIGIIGDDRGGELLTEACLQAGVDPSSLVTDTGRVTTRKTRVVCGSQQVVRLDHEFVVRLGDRARDEVITRFRSSVHLADAVVISDYAKGLLDDSLLAELMAVSGARSVPVLVDPKHHDMSRYRGATVLKLNLDEFAAAANPTMPVPAIRDHLADLVPALQADSGAAVVVVTMGADGLVVFEQDMEPVFIAGWSQDVFDVTGAGDVVAGIMMLGMLSGLETPAAASVANLAAGLSVRHRGVRPVPPETLRQACGFPGTPDGVFTAEELANRCNEWRSAGEKIVFTNGCFDLFHPGHLSLLAYSALLGDRLVVAVDSDASVRRLKGPGRPVIDERARTALIGALDTVDAVVVFDGDLLEVIEQAGPDVLIKGADYEEDDVVGAREVRARGGRVEFAPIVDGYSTTAILDRMWDSAGIPTGVIDQGAGA